MNQLTVMLNGNGANNGVHQSQATTNQFFTFTGQPGFGNTMSLDPSQQVNSNVPQLVTFQSQPAQTQGTATMMLSGSQQQYSAQSGGIGHHQQGAIQYFITQPTQQPSQQPQQILTTSTQSQQFGIVQNLLASGMGAMIPVNQPLAGTNGTIQIPTQTLMAQPNGGLQPGSFVTMTNQPSGTIQFSTNPHHQSGTQLFHQQPQFQFQPGPTLGNGAITITNPNQLITTNQPNGQQFIINQNYSPSNAQSTNLITTNQASTGQPIYQFVLPNGQVIQTVQPQQNTTTLISPQLQLQTQQTVQQQQHQHQPTAITVPFQTNQNGPQQLSNFLTPNLTLNSNGTTTFITQPQQTTPNLSNSSILSHHQSPNLTTNQSTGQLLLTSPSSGPNQQQQSIVLTSPQMHHQSGQSLLIPAVSTASGNQASQQQQSSNGNATTAMVVLTQSIQSNLSGTTNNNNSSVTSLMPSAVLDHKSIKSDSFGASQPTLVLLTSPKMKQPPTSQHALVTAKLVVNGNTETLSGKQQTINNRGQQVTPSGVVKLSLDPKPPKPAPIDQSTQCDHNPQIQKLLENIAEEDESQCSDKTQEEANSTSNNNTPEPERPSRPSSTSSCGSLKIAEDVEEEEEDEIEQEMDNDTENNDAFSTETELDNNSVNESENSEPKNKNSMQCTTTKSSSGNSENCSQTKKVRQQEDKEGYQSSYGSPCHFTDTEDEEEEDLAIMENGEVNDVEEIKLVRKNGLTKAAFDLINNRLQSSDYAEDHATNDSKSSITSGNGAAVGGTDPDDDDMSNDSNGTFSLQIQTPSPSGSNASGLMEPESTTHGLKETTISQICQRIHQGIDLDPIREFAKRFKLFRLARGLTQSQVCHDLSLKTDGQSYSQSAICRFEKMDITPKSAIKIKPVLENWMKTSEEKYPKNKLINTELLSSNDLTLMNNMNSMEGGGSVGVLFSHLNTYEGSAGRSSEDESISSLNSISLEPGKKRKKRTSFTPEQLDALNHFFEKNPKPSSEDMTEISRILCSHDPKINRDVVRVWFCNKRQALKAKRPNFMDPPTPPPAIAPNCADTMRTYSKFQPARTATPPPTYSNLQMSISAASSEASKTLLGLGTLTFPYSSAVSAIPLTLSTSGNNNNLHHQQQQVTSATVPNSQQASLPLNMAVSKSTTNKATSQLTMPINLTQLRPQGHNSTNSATITTFKVEPP